MKKLFYFACLSMVISLIACAKIEPTLSDIAAMPRIKTVKYNTYYINAPTTCQDSFIYDNKNRLIELRRIVIVADMYSSLRPTPTDSFYRETITLNYSSTESVPTSLIYKSYNYKTQTSVTKERLYKYSTTNQVLIDSLTFYNHNYPDDPSYRIKLSVLHYSYTTNKIFIETQYDISSNTVTYPEPTITKDTLIFDAAGEHIVEVNHLKTMYVLSACIDCKMLEYNTDRYTYSSISNPFRGLSFLHELKIYGNFPFIFSKNLPLEVSYNWVFKNFGNYGEVSTSKGSSKGTWQWKVNSQNQAIYGISDFNDPDGQKDELYITYY